MTARKRELLKAVVRELCRADGDAFEVEVLLVRVENFFNPKPTLTEIRETLVFAEGEDLVRGITTASTAQIWAITNKGRLVEL